jgi:predicted glycosyltransferase
MRALILVTHLLGIGHLSRMAALSRALARSGHGVTLVSGGMPSPVTHLDGVDCVQLPALRSAGLDFRGLLDAAGNPASPELMAQRIALIRQALRENAPDIVVTELFPFGRRALAAEFGAVIDALEDMPRRPRLVASVRDILVAPRDRAKCERAHTILRNLYDAVLVHGDPAISRLTDSWPLPDDLGARCIDTGFLHEQPATSAATPDASDIVVSGGGSAASLPLLRAAVASAGLRPDLTWHILVGHGVAEADFATLQDEATGRRNVRIERARADFPALLRTARLSVSQAGYNTVLDIIAAGCRAVLCPFETPTETEQRSRAELFARRGLAICLPEAELTAAALAHAVSQALANPAPRAHAVDVSGAARSVAALERLAACRLPPCEPLPAPAILPADSAMDARGDWQELRDGLARRNDGRPLHVWWRDDDARHDTPALRRLLAVAADLNAPLTLAVIPHGAGHDLADRLAFADAPADRISVALHGWSHANHATGDEKSAEWGAQRPLGTRIAEVERGKAQLTALFGGRLLPMVVPPWNRIAPDLAAVLPDLGLPLLSTFGPALSPSGTSSVGALQRRDDAGALGPTGVNTHADPVDWRGRRSALDARELVAMTLRAAPGEPIGLLTHHLMQDEPIWRLTMRWLAEMQAIPGFEWLSARSFRKIAHDSAQA